MEPVTATVLTTLVLMKASEKVGEKLGEQVIKQGGKLLSLLKSKSPSTASAIELAEQQPLDYGQAVLELEAATQEDPEVAKAVQEVDAAVKADPELTRKIQALADVLKSQPSTVQNSTVQNFAKVAEKAGVINQGGTNTTNFNTSIF